MKKSIGGILTLVGLMIAPLLCLPSTPRSIKLKIVYDEECEDYGLDHAHFRQMVSKVTQSFGTAFDVHFEIAKCGRWDSDDCLHSMPGLLNDLRKKNPKEDSDIILGVTSQIPEGWGKLQGISEYQSAYILLRKTTSTRLLVRVLTHEICHLFGAVDLNEAGSVMNPAILGDRYNDFLLRIIQLNRNRSFCPHDFPLDEEKWNDAIRIYNTRKSLERDEYNINLMLAMLYLEQADFLSLEKECAAVLKIHADCPDAHNLLGTAYSGQSRYQEALDAFETALSLDPGRAEIHYNIGVAWMETGRNDRAIESYLKALECCPRFSQAGGNLAYAYLRTGEIDKAIDQCRRTLRICPDSPEILATLSEALIIRGEWREAEDACRKAIELDREMAGPHNSLGHVYLNKGLFREAADSFQEACRLNPDDHLGFMHLSTAYLKMGISDKALSACREAISRNPDYAPAFVNAASSSLALGQPDEAEAFCSGALGLNPNLAEAHDLYGVIREQKGDAETALREYAEAVRLDPHLATAHLHLANLFFNHRNYQKSIFHYVRALETQPDLTFVYNNLAVLFFRQEDYDKAWEYMALAEDHGVGIHPQFKKALTERLKK